VSRTPTNQAAHNIQSRRMPVIINKTKVLLPQVTLAYFVLFRPFGLPALKDFYQLSCLSNLLTLSVPDEGYSRHESCALNSTSTFVLSHTTNHSFHTNQSRR